MAVWGGLTNSCERREVKSKGEKKRYKHLNAEFQRIARRDKKAFLSHQCKEIEENNRMGKTRDLFKKIRDTKETFHAKMGSIKDRNGMDLTEAEAIKKRWHRLGLLWYWMVCLGNKQRSFYRFWDCIQGLHFGLFCWPWWLLHLF